MKLSEILNLFRQGKSTARSHMKNLIEVAVVDGNFDLIEYNLLKKIALRNNISENRLKAIHESPGDIEFVVPEEERERFEQLYDLVHMMAIDETVLEEEMELCKFFAAKFGYPKINASEIISRIQMDIRSRTPRQETYKRLGLLLE